MALTYALLGGSAALSGSLFGQMQSNPWTYFIMANFCILMGLFMLDVFTFAIQTPEFITRVQPTRRAKGFFGSFLVGVASGFVLGPCTTPVLAVLLSYVATQQRSLFGMSLLFVFAFGMGTLLIILGTFAGLVANIPKGGIWMTRVSHLFGWIFLGVGEYFLLTAGALWG
jgi:thiol:disulfide interchange protein DsbD